MAVFHAHQMPRCWRAAIFISVLACLSGVAFFFNTALTDIDLSRPASFVLLDDQGRIVHARLSRQEEWHMPIPLESMGKWLPLLAVSVEDKRFWRHPGIDLFAIGRSVWKNLMAGKIISGASTITCQVIRMAVPRKRTFRAKILEFLRAIHLEQRLPKEKILETYLNQAPFGGPIRGVEAAALLYFGKHARDVSLGEAALLIGMLKGPGLYRPDRHPDAARARRDVIIRLACKKEAVSDEMAALAFQEPLPERPTAMPLLAWHYADFVFRTLPDHGGLVKSPLNTTLQQEMTNILRATLATGQAGLTAAAAVMDVKTGDLLAYVGNARFDLKKGRAWVDCGMARRSPGSTLKPFAYLLAMERGKLLPATMLADTPFHFGSPAPRNFDRHYRGPVSAATALADSLNAPAVRVSRLVGLPALHAFLKRAGFHNMQKESAHYGDALILGGGEVTLLELLQAYGILASLGEYRALRVRQDTPPSEATRLCCPETAYLIAEILKDPGRLPFLDAQALFHAGQPVAFKTGTSYGFRDAWAIGYTPRHVVGVWFGHEDGSPDPALIGTQIAVPALMRLFRALTRLHPAQGNWYQEPRRLMYAPVCALSGMAPNPACTTTRMAATLPHIAPLPVCRLHAYRRGRPTLLWPKELEGYGPARSNSPAAEKRLLVVSPFADTHYLLTPGASRQRIPLQCEGASYPVHWYADQTYIGTQKDETLFFWTLTPGRHVLSLMDARGRTGAAAIRVTDMGEALRPAASTFPSSP